MVFSAVLIWSLSRTVLAGIWLIERLPRPPEKVVLIENNQRITLTPHGVDVEAASAL